MRVRHAGARANDEPWTGTAERAARCLGAAGPGGGRGPAWSFQQASTLVARGSSSALAAEHRFMTDALITLPHSAGHQRGQEHALVIQWLSCFARRGFVLGRAYDPAAEVQGWSGACGGA